MIFWSNADSSDLKTLKAITILLAKHPKLLDYLFHPNEPRLNASSFELMTEGRSFSSGENLLLQLAIDLWNGEGGASFNDIYHTLDRENFDNLLNAIEFLKCNPRRQF